jgi:2-dehydropantoate 2-reductase
MRIGVVGCGALGSFYGAKLCAAGQDVHFLLRSDYEVVRKQGLQIRSVEGDFHVRPHCAKDAAEIGPCDLVLIGLKTTANHEFRRLIPPLLGPNSAVMTLQNGLGSEELLADLFGMERVLGGLCFVCLNRLEPGLVSHLAHGKVVLGEFQRPAQTRTEQYAVVFREAGVRCEVVDKLGQARWEKLVWNVPFNGLGVAGIAGFEAVVSGRYPAEFIPSSRCLMTDQLLEDPRWSGLVRALMREVILAARHLGFAISDEVIEQRITQTRQMGAYKASTLVDFEQGKPLELESLFLEPLRRARAAKVETAHLVALTQILAALDAAREKRIAVGRIS